MAFSFIVKLEPLLNVPYPTFNFVPVERIPPCWKSKKLSVPDKFIFELFPLIKAPLEKIFVADIICKSLNAEPSEMINCCSNMTSKIIYFSGKGESI